MRYLERGNRVYRIDVHRRDDSGETLWVIAPDQQAAEAFCRQAQNVTTDDQLRTSEVAPDRQVPVTFDDLDLAIARSGGLSPAGRTTIRKMLRTEGKVIPGTITISRAAEQWAQIVPIGRVEQLETSAF